jgi:putative redox protein
MTEDTRPVEVAETGAGRFGAMIVVAGHRLAADEPVEAGGLDAGPGPYDLLKAALGACTTMTLRWVAEREGLALDRVAVVVEHGRVRRADGPPGDLLRRRIMIEGSLTGAERARLMRAAASCPVSRTLSQAVTIETVEGVETIGSPR